MFLKNLICYVEMPPSNRDSSEITRRRKAMALNAWRNNTASLIAGGNNVIREQAQYGTLNVAVAAKQGVCYCAQASSENPYEFNGGGGGGSTNF